MNRPTTEARNSSPPGHPAGRRPAGMTMTDVKGLLGHKVLVIIAATQVATADIGPAGELFGGTRHQDRCLAVFAASLLVSIGAHVVLAGQYGIEGVALTVFRGTIESRLWLRWRAVKHLDIDPSILGLRRAASAEPCAEKSSLSLNVDKGEASCVCLT